MSDFFKNMVKQLEDEDLSLAEDGTNSGDSSGFIDTGSYVFNALLSADLFGGMPNNKALALAGETSTGKSFFALGIAKHFQDQFPTGGLMYYDTEAAITKKMMSERGIDTSRVIIGEPTTVQQFRHKAISFVDAYVATKEAERPPLLMCLDSLGMLSTSKELEDSTEGKDTRDMTRAQIIRAAMRVLRLKLAKAKIPIIVTNHTYTGMGQMYPTQELSGGGGLKFAADQIVMLSKRKEKDGDEVIGNIVHVKTWKSRMSRENKMVDVLLTYDSGLDRYYGLLEMAERYGVFKKVSTRYELPDGSKQFGKAIYQDPGRFFDETVLSRINEGVKREFSYGKNEDTSAEEVKNIAVDEEEV